MLAEPRPSGEHIATPSVCLYMILLKLNFTPGVSLFINAMKTTLEINVCASWPSQYKASAQILIVFSRWTFVKRLEMSKESMKILLEAP